MLLNHCHWECLGFPSGSDGEESACNTGDLGAIPGLGRSPGEGHGNPFQYLGLENPPGQRSLVGYSPQGCKELDTTERLSLSLFLLGVLVLTLIFKVNWHLTIVPTQFNGGRIFFSKINGAEKMEIYMQKNEGRPLSHIICKN